MKNNKAKFFCENCGSEVPENARVCKVCGKFFISVRCPQCGATGTHDEFKDGCPKCGYAVGKGNNSAKSFNSADKKGKNIALRFSGYKNYKSSASTKTEDSSLPVWIYLATALVLVIVLFAVYSCIR